MTLVIGLDLAIATRLAPEGLAAVQVGVVIDLEKRLQRHAQALAVAKHPTMMVRDAPRARIDVKAWIKLTVLGKAAQFRIAVAAAKAPVATAGSSVVFQHLHPIAGIAQLIGRGH